MQLIKHGVYTVKLTLSNQHEKMAQTETNWCMYCLADSIFTVTPRSLP